ncbi:MAG TPA: outer membrane beta-barrel protein [Stellaceae bacterium]
MSLRFLTGAAAIALIGAFAAASPARAQQAAPAPAPEPAAPAHFVWNGITISGHVDAGTTVNPDSPDNNINFGQLFTDRANSFRVNQTNIAAEQDIDSSAASFNWGWRVEGMYGTDSRFTHTIGLFDRATNSPYQWDLVEASLSGHFPVIFSGGIDVKAGNYPTPIGYEVIDANGNFFYTHSYIFNYGIPLKHTGAYAVGHVTDMIDVWAGADTGVNAGAPFFRSTDDNHSGAFLGGFAINNPIPNLTVLGLAHIGAENGYVAGGVGPAPDRNHYSRQIYDLVTTYKPLDALTLANETNFIRDDLFHATAEGTAFYGIYKLNDQWSFGARGEVFRDDEGFFVASFQESQAFMNAERGIPVASPIFGSGYNAGKATYSGLTIGANWTPAIPLPDALPSTLGLTIRPEFRWDHAWGLNPGVHPFGVTAASAAAGTVGTKDDQILLSVDAIIAF